jgi:phytoene desaturase
MADIAGEMGVDVHLDEPVEEILFEGRRAVGVRTPKDSYRADALVVNADFARAMTKLVPNHLRRRWTDQKIARKKYSCSTFMLYLGLEGREQELAHHTIYLAKDYEGNIADIERHHRLTDDPSIYVQNAAITDPTLAPPGHSTLYVLAPVTHQHPNVDWSVERDRFRDVVLDQLQKVGIRDVRQRLRYEQVISPADWDQNHQIYRGATFNLAHNLGQMLMFRPHNRFEDLESVYLVGGGTHPGSGLPVIYSSARITAQQICDDFGIRAHLNPAVRPKTRRGGSHARGRIETAARVRLT